jgi:hypothetical protein
MRQVRKIAELMRDHFSLVYGKDYPTNEIEPSDISEIGLLGADEEGQPTLEPREGEPIVRLFAIVGKSQAVEMIGEGGDPYELITEAMTKLPEGTVALSLWAQATMRAIPNDLKGDFEAGASPNQPRIWHEIKERGRVLETDQIVVIGADGFLTDCYLAEGRLRMEITDAHELAGRMPIALASLYVMVGFTNSLYERIRREVAEPIADQFAEVDEMIARVVAMVEGDTPETPTNTESEISNTAESVAANQPGREAESRDSITAETLIAEIRRRTEHLDPTDLDHLQSLTADLDEIAEAIRKDLALDTRACGEITRALGIVSGEIGLTIPEAVAKLRALGLDD